MSGIELIPLSEQGQEQFKKLYEIRFSDFVQRNFGGEVPSLESHLEWMRSAVHSQQYRGYTINFGEEIVGGCSLKHISRVNMNAEFDIYLSEASAGKGFGRGALAQLVAIGFGELNLHRIYAYLIESNQGALNMYTKLGFVQEGVMRDHVRKDGTYHNSIIIGLLKEDYEGHY